MLKAFSHSRNFKIEVSYLVMEKGVPFGIGRIKKSLKYSIKNMYYVKGLKYNLLNVVFVNANRTTECKVGPG